MNKYQIRSVANLMLRGHLRTLRRVMGKLVIDDIGGRKILYDPDTDIGASLYFSGVFEKNELDLCRKYLKKDSVVLDIGANIGLHSIYFSQIAQYGLIVAIEPSQETFCLLLQNIYGIDNVVPINIGAADQTNFADFFVAVDNAFSSLKDTKRKNIKQIKKVLCLRLDDLFMKLNLAHIDFIKIDVEGLEKKVLEGMREIIDKYHPILFCEIYQGTDSNEQPEETVKFVVERGYNAFIFDGQKIVSYKRHDDRFYNYLFLPEEKKLGT